MASPEDPTACGKRKRSHSSSSSQEDAAGAHRPQKTSRESPVIPDSSCDLRPLRSGLLETLVVFGDSYSASAGSGGDSEKTWVSYLRDHPTLTERGVSFRNFSFPGATTEDDLDGQLKRFFSTFPPKKTPSSKPALDPTKTCYVFALGINDCGRTDEGDLDEIVEKILDAAHALYIKAGAREFLFIDVPPIDRSPGGIEDQDILRGRVDTWNTQLNARVSEYARETPRASVACFSAHALLTDILDNPEEHGFEEDDTTDEGGAIWADELHVMPAVQEIMARRVREQLGLKND